ncbi:MAG: hypothetical protein U5Q44_11160 [Dehalococcoidia bacterium]|nr:hypothetical protein [Dehalococcoidia bacterium]
MATYTVFLSEDATSGHFTVVCPALPGCVTQGKNRKDALEQVRQAMDSWGAIAAEEGILPLRETAELLAVEERALKADRQEEGFNDTVERLEIERDLPQPKRIALSPNTDRLPVRANAEYLTLLSIRALVRSVGMSYEEFLEQALLLDDEDEDE